MGGNPCIPYGNAGICPLALGHSADVLIWGGYGHSRTQRDFFDFEVGGHGGAYKGRVHIIVPFIGPQLGRLATSPLITSAFSRIPYG